uniref:Pyridoxal kinase n=3 Tax=Schistosoma japonicum TaxID=6182 RepID=C1L3Q7_SCHJA|nr:pyridoxal (pyridoxine, vitamin B6) kinase [Schistosoma japonicum]
MALKAALNRLRVLCIQSHVVHGYVGNKIAVFPLQVLGIEVDYINSVQFSNHTGYAFVRGQVLDAACMKDLYLGLKENGLHKYTHVLTGYMASSSSLEAVADIVSDLKKENSDILYYCDPVLGDNGRLYVPPELVQIYQEKILPLSDVLLPNQFEAETLSGIRITDEQSALNCINYLHEKYHIPTVIITSTNMALSPVMCGYGSRLTSSVNNNVGNLSHQMNRLLINENSEYDRIRFKIPLVNYNFIGTGDLFAALTLARLESKIENENGERLPKYSFKDALQSVLSTMQAVILRTLKMSENDALNISNVARIELKIIQSIDDIRNPIVGDYVEEM